MTSSTDNPTQHLRSLTNTNLLDLLADAPDLRGEWLYPLLRQRGLTPEQIDIELRNRQAPGQLRSYQRMHQLGKLAKLFSLVIAVFNLISLYLLFAGDGSHKVALAVFSLSLLAFGFYLGFKLNTQLYLGTSQQIFCGFPSAVGAIDVDDGEETLRPPPAYYRALLLNTFVAVNLALFPALLLSYLLN